MKNKLLIIVGLAVLGAGAYASTTLLGKSPTPEIPIPEAAKEGTSVETSVAATEVNQTETATSQASTELAEANTGGKLGPEDGLFGDAPLGHEDAPVTVIEYASLTCSHCATFHKNVSEDFKKLYVDKGHVKFLHRDYPTSPTNVAIALAVLSRCSGNPERYHAFVDLFMRQQDKLFDAGDKFFDEVLRIARFGGMSKADVDACLANQALGQSVIDSAVHATFYGINSTPSFVIGRSDVIAKADTEIRHRIASSDNVEESAKKFGSYVKANGIQILSGVHRVKDFAPAIDPLLEK